MRASKNRAEIETFEAYFEQLKNLDRRDATEHTLRPALHVLLQSVAAKSNPKIKVIPEPKRDESGRGAPDVKFKIGENIIGYLENKKVEIDLSPLLKSDQIKKYRRLSDNLLLTNYLEWIWIKNGSIIRETLAYQSDVGNHKARLDIDKAERVCELIESFLSTPPKGIARVKDLALALATRCHDLREFLVDELLRQERAHQEGRLYGLFNVFKKDVFQELALDGFADAFAQMLGYGLFLARLNSDGKSPISLSTAKQHIPANFELIRELVNFLDELDKPEYGRIKWLIEEILSLMNTLDLPNLLEDLSFTKRQGRLWSQTEEERLLYTKDPYVYFYEDFLKAYDKDMRKSRGVYYTPKPVVNFIIRAINDILRKNFHIKTGLADRKKVTVLDFATGTGTFLLEVLQQIFETIPEGLHNDIIREHTLKNLYGFEYLIAPYTIAHLKLAQYLHDKDFRMRPGERLQIYLTNTLEPIKPQPNFLLPALSKEVELAQAAKDKQILVITGNPPYSGISLNNGDWISRKIDAYKWVDGKPFGERKHWLNDDYVKFIRFAQWKMDNVEQGMVGIITNHSFLDNPTFRGMRQSLMETFNQLYFLDLHGSTKRKETAPDGGKDENVFDIEQGVCISLLIKKSGLQRNVFHADLWGKRLEKYRSCMDMDFNKICWQRISPNSPHYFFVPRNEDRREVYESGWQVTSIFKHNVTGIVTARDDLAIAFKENELIARLRELCDENLSIKDIRHKFFARKAAKPNGKYAAGDTRGWKLPEARKALQEEEQRWGEYIVPCCYRPFDKRVIYFRPSLVDWGRWDMMRHMISRDNVGLDICRQTISANWQHALCVDCAVDDSFVSNKTRERGYLLPLFLYKSPESPKNKKTLFDESDSFQGKESTENFSSEFRAFIDGKYGCHYKPEEIFGYIYAVLYSPSYRKKYAEFLKIDFPRIPFTDKRAIFEKLARLGWELVQVHLLKSIPLMIRVAISKGNDEIKRAYYKAAQQRLYFNEEQYFSPVPEDVWNFSIGGYQVLEKYFKCRKGRKLGLDEKENVMNIVNVIAFTIKKMHEIDTAWKVR
jgi:predicted helicase